MNGICNFWISHLPIKVFFNPHNPYFKLISVMHLNGIPLGNLEWKWQLLEFLIVLHFLMWVVRYAQCVDMIHFGVFFYFGICRNFWWVLGGKYWLRYDIFCKAGGFVSNIVLPAFLITATGFFIHGIVLGQKKKRLLVLVIRSPRFLEATQKKSRRIKKGDFGSFLGFWGPKRVKCSFLTNVFYFTLNQHKKTFHLSYCMSLYDNFFFYYIVCPNLPNAVGRWGLRPYILTKKIAKKIKIARSPRFFHKVITRTNRLYFWPK